MILQQAVTFRTWKTFVGTNIAEVVLLRIRAISQQDENNYDKYFMHDKFSNKYKLDIELKD